VISYKTEFIFQILNIFNSEDKQDKKYSEKIQVKKIY